MGFSLVTVMRAEQGTEDTYLRSGLVGLQLANVQVLNEVCIDVSDPEKVGQSSARGYGE